MGTRSTLKIYREDKLLLSLYKQYDGYPDGFGLELKEFIQKGVFVNGIKLITDDRFMFNGIEDFALQVVTHFKEGCGGLYATTEDDSQEYNYKIVFSSNWKTGDYSLRIECLEEPSFEQTWNGVLA